MYKKILAKLYPVPVSQKGKKSLLHRNSTIILILSILVIFAAIGLGSLNDARKPAIYLYPTSDMNVEVKVDVNGFLYKDIPTYGDGWDVFVTEEGIIENKYDYLFYEALLWQLDLPEEGWVVEYSNIEAWLSEKLPKLGLNKKEAYQFMEYWLEELPEANYYEIKLLDQGFLEKNMTLDISPKPDTVIRLIFNFKSTENETVLREPEIVTPSRDGFTVVEWGGLLED